MDDDEIDSSLVLVGDDAVVVVVGADGVEKDNEESKVST
jgi:hypothetical protein